MNMSEEMKALATKILDALQEKREELDKMLAVGNGNGINMAGGEIGSYVQVLTWMKEMEEAK